MQVPRLILGVTNDWRCRRPCAPSRRPSLWMRSTAADRDRVARGAGRSVGIRAALVALRIALVLAILASSRPRVVDASAQGAASEVDPSASPLAICFYHADGTGAVVRLEQTDEFGNPSATAGTRTQPFGYTGEPVDPSSGLVDLRARLYDPPSGRFLTRDGFPGYADLPLSLNRYSYVLNDPATLTDPSGEVPILPILGACAGGALVDVAVDALAANAGGEKLTGSRVLQTAAMGCAGGLVGLGLGKAAVRAGRAVRGGGSAMQGATCAVNSFAADTPVATEAGSRPIGSIRLGERVLAWDEDADAVGFHEVTALLAHDDPLIVHLTLAGEPIQATPEHRFFVVGKGWVEAEHLRAGDEVRRADGGSGAVEAISLEQRTERMHNLTVEGAHTYFVGGGRWLVHNECSKTNWPPIKKGATGGPTAGKNFSLRVQDQAWKENPEGICVYCRRTAGRRRQVDHVIAKTRGGNATLENAQIVCNHCNPSKGNRDFPVNPPPGFEGPWPPSWWPRRR